MEAKDRVEEEALLDRTYSASSVESQHEEQLEFELDDFADAEDHAYESLTGARRPKWLRFRVHKRAGSASSLFTFHTPRRRRSLHCRILQLALLAPYIIFSAIVICGLFFPSYANPPARYWELRHRIQEFGQRVNDGNEKIYIAASLYDHEGEVVSGQWGQSVLRLIKILGPENVFLSIYENDPDPGALAALDTFRTNITCQSAIVTERLDLAEFPHVSTPDGSQRLKRMQFLADVRNRALRPLEDEKSPAYNTRFDKLLYLNDVVFDPIDAANLLLNTNVDESTGRASYRATCAVDFINPFKFYDTFATRDLEGYDMGVPFYPWFTNAGKGESRKDVWHQKDAVRVKSCWGGMVAFDAKYFQARLYSSTAQKESLSTGNILEPQTFHYEPHHGLRNPDNLAIPSPNSSSLRFRAETDTYWDASECCLIHADLAAMGSPPLPNDTGIYMNPYIRVAYSSNVLPWLTFTKRFERLYPIIHSIANFIAQRPSFNPRQFQEPGDEVENVVWTWKNASRKAGTHPNSEVLGGHFERVKRIALPGGFCGMRKLYYINEHPSKKGGSKWMEDKLPIVGRRR
ncbi:glycosyltransferase family 69 protein [Pseudocercospora fijiensis CIRAD86]|uniref:Glycosyltransferase family 69 protein n=1 Tax=Pseudocercospora fijiensis (strain CIRAD86) TaxID=383855 RepID=M3B6J6_PSEFD|nr:glycosyltransferase family 69 protein [Pseudocercospora fijiensis CIRAD86]EME84963.1 glycosyltransferase family 69 protein [Pseudocercospora fijiensis CIRAD86]